MNDLFILSNARCYGGAEKSLETILPELEKEFNIYIFIENDSHYSAIKEMGLKNTKIIIMQKGKNIVSTIVNINKIKNLISTLNEMPYFLTNTRNGAIYLAILSMIKHIDYDKTIIYVRDYLWKYKRIVFGILKKAHFAIPTKAILDRTGYLDKYIKKERVHVTLNAIRFSNEIMKNKTKKYILNLANFSEWKGQIYLIKAFEKSNLAQEGFKLHICGAIHEEKCFEKINQYIKEHKMDDDIEISTFTNDTSNLYNESQFVVVSSIGDYGGPETFGRTIIEAWSHRKTVIAFDVGGPSYIIESGVNGILVPEKDIVSLASSMCDLAFDNNYRNTLAQNGFEKSKLEYTPRKVVDRLLKIWIET